MKSRIFKLQSSRIFPGFWWNVTILGILEQSWVAKKSINYCHCSVLNCSTQGCQHRGKKLAPTQSTQQWPTQKHSRVCLGVCWFFEQKIKLDFFILETEIFLSESFTKKQLSRISSYFIDYIFNIILSVSFFREMENLRYEMEICYSGYLSLNVSYLFW